MILDDPREGIIIHKIMESNTIIKSKFGIGDISGEAQPPKWSVFWFWK